MTACPDKSTKPLHVVFLHLDLGIGGAEQLVVNLALASLPRESQNANIKPSNSSADSVTSSTSLNGRVSIFTTHCNQNHCFDAVNKTTEPPGILASSVHVVRDFLPVTIFGKGTAFCSTIRMIYLSFMARRMYPDADVFVLDVLPTPIPYLVQRSKCVVYYCHFPDKLLTRDTVNGVAAAAPTGNAKGGGGVKSMVKSQFKQQYRKVLDYMEEWTMSYADLICVNSNFTKTEVTSAFPSLKINLQKQKNGSENGTSDDADTDADSLMKVLYPAIDLDKFIQPDFARKERLLNASNDRTETPIVSLNRFERKKNIQVLLHAYASVYEELKTRNQLTLLPPLVIDRKSHV